MDAPKHMTSSSPLHVVGRLMLVPAMILAILSGCMLFDEINRCHDGGGRWNDTTDACELDEQREDEASVGNAPTTATHPFLVGRAEV